MIDRFTVFVSEVLRVRATGMVGAAATICVSLADF